MKSLLSKIGNYNFSNMLSIKKVIGRFLPAGRQAVERSHEVASEEPGSRTRPKHWIPCQARNDNVFALQATAFGGGGLLHREKNKNDRRMS